MRLINPPLRPLLTLAALAAFFVNPFFACVVGEGDFEYGAEEMRAAVEGTWEVTLAFSDGRQQTLTVTLAQGDAPTAPTTAVAPARPSLIRPAAACENRTLVKSAEACSSTSTMPLAVTFVSGDESFRSVAMSGQLWVPSTIFRSGHLQLRFGELQVMGTVTPAGEASGFGISNPGPIGTATVVRTAL